MSNLPAKKYRVRSRQFVPLVDRRMERIVFACRLWQPLASWVAQTGDGHATVPASPRVGWWRVRDIVAGQWRGPWQRERMPP